MAMTALLLPALLPLRAEPTDDEKKAFHDAQQAFKDGAFTSNDRRVRRAAIGKAMGLCVRIVAPRPDAAPAPA